MIQTDKGHFWLTFENGYMVSIFNGFGSYSENHFKTDLLKQTENYIISSKNCEIAVIYNGEFVTRNFVECDDSVKGYVSADELADIIYKVKKLKGELKNKPDTEIMLEDNKGNTYTIIQSERIDMQEKLNKSIQQLLKENQELKKELEENENPLRGIFAQVNDDMLLRSCGAMRSEIDGYKTQQKEFIKYLEDESKEVYRDGGLRQNIFRQILQKYKQIIGDDK